ncbi:GNAT family N-acetyltransferase [Catellatospora tritici]|uniref:GNAT family N-acetyltransferase n=1 Tax=Catellatospora tritici TaxID=2851566 RepID=UPI0027E0F9E2|nr:GNAT family N-acetyltransferase [Catellatospora tritici]
MTDADLLTAEDVILMQGLAQRVAALRPDLVNAGASYGELAWVWNQGAAWERFRSWRCRLWFVDTGSGEELVAWGRAHLPTRVKLTDGTVRDSTSASLSFQVHPEHADLVEEVVRWFERVAVDVDRSVVLQTCDPRALMAWGAAGYGPEPDGEFTLFCVRTLDDIATPVLPEGFRFRSAADVGPVAAAQAHIDAWNPSTYSIGAGQALPHTASYRADLHPVVEAPDGTLVATTMIWLDEANRSVEFEPFGTHPGYRGLGIAKAMALHGMHLSREAGATQATVACDGEPGNAALRLYESVGFKEFTRDVTLYKKKSS